MKPHQPDFIVIGQIVRSHGVHGELKVNPLTDCPARFNELRSITVEFPDDTRGELDVSRASVRNNAVYLQLKGVESREQADALRGLYIVIKAEQLLPLAEGSFYHFELLGAMVKTTSGKQLGRVDEVMELTANDVLVVRNRDNEYLIPMIKDVIMQIDTKTAEIVIEPIDGLLDLN